MNYQNNGRINLVDRQIYPEYQMFHQKKEGLNEFKNEAVKSILQKNPLSDVFFSKQNIDYLQNKIIQTVYELTNGQHRIGRQSDIELEIVMRSIYLQFSLNQSSNLREQIRQLDEKVIDEVCPGIITAVKQYLQYKQDITNMPQPIELPKTETIKGEKSLQLPPWF
jgi:hypothetical protein